MSYTNNPGPIRWAEIISDQLFAASAGGLLLALRKKSLKTAVIERIAST
jgi:hypothetical protein